MVVLHCPVLKDRQMNKSLCFGAGSVPVFMLKNTIKTYLFGPDSHCLKVVGRFAYQAGRT